MYARMAPVYRAAGWQGVLPLPPKSKFPPPQGFTGWHSPDASDDQVQIWMETAAERNIGLRMPEGVVGIDCDHYKDKRGLDTIALAEERWGKLPATWMSTAREGGSGIRFYRVPEGTRFPGKLELDGLSDVEIIQRGHRFAVVSPSVHPNGSEYHWYDPEGCKYAPIPRLDQLAALPESWIQGLQSNGKLFGLSGEKRSLSKDDVLSELLSFNDALGEPCKVIADRLAESIQSLDDPGARHDSALHHSMAIVGYGHLGHAGAVTALEAFQKEFIARISVDRTDADGEFDRMILGAVARLEGGVTKEDPCEADPTAPTEEEIVAAVKRMRIKEEATVRFNTFQAGDLEVPQFRSAWDLAREVPDTPDWLVDGLIPRNGIISLAAQRKVGKTTIVHKMIEAICTGGMFLDKFQCHKPNGTICIFDLELPEDKLGYWLNRNGLAGQPDVFAVSLRGRVHHLNILNDAHRKAIADELKSRNAKFVVLDPLGPYLRMLGADENDATQAGRAIDMLARLKDEAEIDTLLIPLHSGHGDGKRARGSSVMLDSPDVNISLYRNSTTDEVRHLSAEGRDVDLDIVSFTYDLESGEITVQGDGNDSEARKQDVMTILEIVSDVPGIIQSRIPQKFKTFDPGCGKKRAMSALAQAIGKGFVRAEKTADSKTAPIAHYLTEQGKNEINQERQVVGEAA